MYGLIGKKLSHSFSADFFNKKFAEEGIDATYHLLPLETIKDFPGLLQSNPEIKGLNVTIPYKEEVIPYLTELSEEAREIGAVNVIKFIEEKNNLKLVGYNSDCIGFRDSLQPLLRKDIEKALILGTGGASKAVSYVLNNLGIDFKFVSRTPKEGQLTYEDLDKQIMKDHLLIINTTPLGMFPDIKSCAPVPYEELTERHICYDLVYNPGETEFLKRSAKYGAITKNGLEMLHLQALAAWNIWNR